MTTTMTDVNSLLENSPVSHQLSAGCGEVLSLDMMQIGKYLALVVEELRVLHEAVEAVAHVVDNLD